jgi:hypothetical protein
MRKVGENLKKWYNEVEKTNKKVKKCDRTLKKAIHFPKKGSIYG